MGRGDKKTEKGKRTMGSFGNSRPHKVKAAPVKVAEKPAKKAAPKKTKKAE